MSTTTPTPAFDPREAPSTRARAHRKRSSSRVWSAIALLVASSRCAPPSSPHGDASAQDASDASAAAPCRFEADIASQAPPEGEVLQRQTVMILGAPRELVLLRLPTSDGRASYAAWIAPRAAASSAVLLTLPYEGIDWTGEAVDQRWRQSCAQPVCALPDVDSPDAPSDPGVIAYKYLSPAAFAEAATVHVANGAGVLGVFGRFYAGGSWYSYVRAMVAGLRFLQSQSTVDPTRVAISGGSFGGFLSFYAAAFAPEGIAPRAVVSFFPPVDLREQVRFSQVIAPTMARTPERRAMFATFIAPYLRRAVPDVGPIEAADYRCFAPEYIVPKVRGEVFVAWDDWDMLVPPSVSESLVRQLGPRGHAHPYRHATAPDFEALPLDHGPFDRVGGADAPYSSFEMFSYAFVHLRISDGPVLVPIHAPTLDALLTRWRDEQRAGPSEPAYAQRLAELADDRVTLFNLQTGAQTAAAPYLSEAIARVWGVTIPAESLQSQLRAQGLPR